MKSFVVCLFACVFFFAFGVPVCADPETDAKVLKDFASETRATVWLEYGGLNDAFKDADERAADLWDRLKKSVPAGNDYNECEDLIFSAIAVLLNASTNVQAATEQWNNGEAKYQSAEGAYNKSDWTTAINDYQSALGYFAGCSVYSVSPGYAKDQIASANNDYLDCAEGIIVMYEKK